jgi:Tfp pilus assembly protein PilF
MRAARWLLVLAVFLTGCNDARPPKTSPPSATELAELDRGVGLMGRFDFAAARDVFAALVIRHPDWFEARFDVAIATLNRQQEGDERVARDALRELLRQRPDDPRVLYTLGVITLHGEAPKDAEPFLRRAAESDPHDAYAQYFLAQSRLMQEQIEEALAGYERAINLDPRLRSAYYGASQALRRLGRHKDAASRLEEFQRQRNNPLATLAEFKYTRMGPKSEVIGAPRAAVSRTRPDGPLFAEPREISGNPVTAPASLPVASAADIDGDGRIDLFIPGGRGATGTVLLARGDHFERDAQHPLAKVRGVEFAAWGDVDNDGLTDALLCRAGASPILMRQSPRGTWNAVHVPALEALGEARDCLLFDADHDGDIDMFIVTRSGERILIANNGDGTFRSLADRFPRQPRPASAMQVLAADIDDDRDVDVVVLRDRGGHEAFENELMWQWRPARGLDAFARQPAVAAVAADLEGTGELDILTLTPDLGVLRWQRGKDGAWKATAIVPASGKPRRDVRTQLAVADLDGDGRPEIVATSPRGVAIWRLSSRGAERQVEIDEETITAWTLAQFDARGPSLIAHHRNGATSLYAPGSGRFAFAQLQLTGRDDRSTSLRSNASGIGVRIAARVGGRWVVESGIRATSGPGQSLTPIAVGLGGEATIDYVRIDWSDGVLQTEIGLDASAPHRIAETQRQLSSCPVVFAWNGMGYTFVTDILGVGGLGYLIAPGHYAPPRPWENLLLPKDLLQPREGRYVVKITEPMEETAYVDSVKLVAFDLPLGWDIAIDERMQIGPPNVTGRPLFFRRETLPDKVINDRGEDVTDVVRAADLRAADPGLRDRRFIGRLVRDHVLTLEFGTDLDAGRGTPVLVADGWIEYPYSQTMFAAWQAHAEYRAASLEARGVDGRWRMLLKEFGYPAGMPRRSAVPLPRLPKGTRALRLSTNQEIYWDRLAIAWTEGADVVTHEARMVAAEARPSGFPRRTTGPQQQPGYDYGHRVPLWDTRIQSGRYTDFRRIDELVSTTDDAVAIIGAGEELHLEFDAALPPLAPGWSRRFVLKTHGWAKDMDLYTRDGESVEPLPTSGQHRALRDRLHAQYNQRFESGR